MSHIEKFWVPATSEHVTRVMNGVTVEARFRDHESKPWDEGEHLGGWLEGRWKKAGLGSWNFCQVYDPPQWFIDKPEPGEGYRLLAKFPDETVQGGDFACNPASKEWMSLRDGCMPTQAEGIWYRRKTEQPKPEPKFAVGQRVKIIGPGRAEKVRYNWEQGMDNQVGKTGVVTSSHDGSFGRLYQLSGIVEWNFQEDYLEHFVEPKHYVLQVGDTAEFPGGVIVEVSELRGLWLK